MAITDRRIATQVYGGKAPTAYKVYTPPKKKKAPATIQAVAGDTFDSLAKKLGLDVADVVKANPNDSTVKAGTFLNAPLNKIFREPSGIGLEPLDKIFTGAGIKPMYSPTQDAGYRDPRGNRPGGWRDEAQREAIENAQPIITPEPQVEPRDYIKEILTSGGGAPGAQPGETFLNREWWRDLLGTDGSRIGIGAGVNVAGALGIGIQPPPTGTPTSQSLAEYADFRKAEAAAAYQDREARFMTGSLGITAMRDKPGYYGQYGTEQDLANQANGDFSKLYNPMYTPSATQTLGEKLDAGEYSPGAVPPQTAEEALRQMWEDVYMNPANKGRGGGIVGWIEERTGIAIDPETFFTEGASSEVLARMLEVFRPDELNYLESHGFLVPVEDYDLPNYNYPAPSYYRSQGGGGGGYGGYGSGPSGQVPRQTYLGLVSWSI